MRAGWYIINYHNVDWEDSLLTRAIGGTVRPDVFREQLQGYAEKGELISIREGLSRLRAGRRMTRPTFSLWFDDGFAGVRRHALPICREFGVTAAMSVNSRFALRQEMFWRAQLAHLVLTDGLRLLRWRLRRRHGDMPRRLKGWLIENFSAELRKIVEELYLQFTTEAFRTYARRIFDTAEGIRKLAEAGWAIANHTAAHYPLTPEQGWAAVQDQYEECDVFVKQADPESSLWVIPFSYGAENYMDRLRQRALIVDGGCRANTPRTFADGVLYRQPAPITRRVPYMS